MNTAGADGGVNGADAKLAAASAAVVFTRPAGWTAAPSSSAPLLPVTAMKVCCSAGTGAHCEPRLYFTPLASTFPELSWSPLLGTSGARLKSRTAEPSRGGTKEAAIVSMFLGALGGHVSFTTTTSGPGVSGIFVERSVLPVAWSLIVIVPVLKHLNVSN